MAVPGTDIKRLDARKTKELCQRILMGAGVTESDAAAVAENLIQADLRGISSHGISRMMVYTSRLLNGLTNTHPNIQVVSETPSSLVLDGDNGLGAVIGTKAMQMTIEKAKKTGVAMTSVRGGNHYGIAAYYGMMAARQDMIGMAFTNAPKTMAPWGGMEPMIGTNPFCFAIPTGERRMFVLDCATSVVARGKINLAEIEDKPIPEGWGLDKEGHPSTNATAVLEGVVLPFGTYKGSGLSIVIDILCALLSGANFGSHIGNLYGDSKEQQNLGYFFGAIDIKSFTDPAAFKAKMDQMIGELKGSKKAPGVDEIYMPGEIEFNNEAENLVKGIEVGPGVLRDLNILCQKTGVDDKPENYIIG